METASLGSTSLRISRLGLGTWQAAGWATSNEDTFVRVVHRAMDLGINFFDTAEAYGKGRSEELLGLAIAGRRHEVVIASKVSPRHSRPLEVRAQLELSLKRLGVDYIDLYQHHWPSSDVPLADTISELCALKKEGKIRAVGISNYMEPEWNEIQAIAGIDSLQPCYNLLWRSVERRVLDECRARGMAVLPYSPLAQGILAGRFDGTQELPKDPRRQNVLLTPDRFSKIKPVLETVRRIAEQRNKTRAQISLRWLLDNPAVTAPIVGASSIGQLEENVGALGWELSPEEKKELDDVSRPVSEDLSAHDTLWGWHPRAKKIK